MTCSQVAFTEVTITGIYTQPHLNQARSLANKACTSNHYNPMPYFSSSKQIVSYTPPPPPPNPTHILKFAHMQHKFKKTLRRVEHGLHLLPRLIVGPLHSTTTARRGGSTSVRVRGHGQMELRVCGVLVVVVLMDVCGGVVWGRCKIKRGA